MDLESYLEEFTHRDWQTTTEGTVRLAMIGLGWWTTEQAIPAVQRSDLCETTTLVSGSAEKADRLASVHNVPNALTYDEFHEGRAAGEYDAVYIATPNAYHLPYAKTAASLDKAVLCEKPMEATVERAEQLVAVCQEAAIPLMVAYRLHTQPPVRRARELIREGFIGEPTLIHANASQQVLNMIPDETQWRLQSELSGYGATLMDIGIYPVNTACFLLESDPASVQALMNSSHDAFSDVPDERVAFTCQFENGVHMASTASLNAYGDTHLDIIGSDGRIRFSPAFSLECGLTVAHAGIEADLTFEQVDEMTEEFDYFADRVLTGGDIHADGEQGLRDMHVLAGLYESGETGERVEI